jgi:hypothetical protein
MSLLKTVRLLAPIAIVFSAACAGNNSASSIPARGQAIAANGTATEKLYVSNAAGSNGATMTVYNGQNVLVNTVNARLIAVSPILTDSAGRVFAATPRTVTIYKSGASPVIRVLNKQLTDVKRIALDTFGNLYAMNPNNVKIFQSARNSTVRTVSVRGSAIAADSLSNLYVGEETGSSPEVAVYAPASKVPSRTITKGVVEPYLLAFDASGNLYVDNNGPASGCGSIAVYAPGASMPSYTLTQSDGICEVQGMAFDSAGHLYTANLTGGSPNGNVTEFSAFGSTLIRTIAQGIDEPSDVAVTQAGTIYVSNRQDGSNDVTVYGQDGTLLSTISVAIDDPVGIALGK